MAERRKKKNTQQLLTEKEMKFIELWNGNATETAKAAGFDGNHISRLLANPRIQAALERMQDVWIAQAARKLRAKVHSGPEGVLDNYDRIIELALIDGDLAQAKAANDSLARCFLMLQDRGQQEGIKPFPNGTIEIYRSKWLTDSSSPALPPADITQAN